jgi:hypothetical protein
MGNITISVKDEVEDFWRRYAKSKYGNTKGSLARAAEEAFGELRRSDEQERVRRRALEILEKGYAIGFKGWKNRSEMYASRKSHLRH